MAKINLGTVWKPQPLKKKTSQSKKIASVKMSSMNKSKRRSFKPDRGQG